MTSLYHPENRPRNPATAVERHHIRWRGLPYATFRLVRRYGLPTSTAGTIAELAGFDTDMVRR